MIEVPTYTASVYIAGDLETVKRVCREFCMRVGLCVTIEPIEYVFKGGCEAGVRVGLINYPRFPETPEQIFEYAWALGVCLRTALSQWSFTVVATDKTVFETTRE